jgi:hypothetical protein
MRSGNPGNTISHRVHFPLWLSWRGIEEVDQVLRSLRGKANLGSHHTIHFSYAMRLSAPHLSLIR